MALKRKAATTEFAAKQQRLDLKRANYEDIEKRNVFKQPRYDDTIVKEDFYTYLPFTLNANYSDTIRIEIQSSDVITAIYDSYISIKGTYAEKTPGKNYTITNNAAYFLFDEMQLILGSSQIIDICRQPGITSTVKGLTSHTKEDRGLGCTSWKLSSVGEENVFKDGRFSCCIPLKTVFGFAEDYTKVLVNMRVELVLIRSKSDFNCYTSEDDPDGTDVEFKIEKVAWEVPHVTLGDELKLNLMDELRTSAPIVIAFRQWELHELPAFNNARTQVWRIKNSNELEKPRWILVALQKDNANVRKGDATEFTHSDLVDMRVFLNSQVFPYQRMNLDFQHNDYIKAFLNYKRFPENYYGRESDKCLVNYTDFKKYPIFVIDCAKQQESLKDSTVDIRLEMESSKNFTVTTKAYCLILHDTLIEYDPFTENVTRYVRS